MNQLTSKTCTFVLHSALVALYALPAASAAAAAPLPRLSGLFHRTPSHISKPQYVMVDFHNAAMQERELRVGTSRFPVLPHGDVRLGVTVGADVRVYSPVNSHIHATLLTVTPESNRRVVEIH